MLLLVTKEIGESYLLACWHKNQFGVAGLCSIKAKPGWQLERQKRHPYQHALPRTKTLVYQLKHFKVKVLASKIYSSLLPKERFTVPPSILTDLLGLSAARLTAALVPCRAYSSHLLSSHPSFLNRRLVYAVDLKQVSWRKLVWWLLICCKLSNSHNYESEHLGRIWHEKFIAANELPLKYQTSIVLFDRVESLLALKLSPFKSTCWGWNKASFWNSHAVIY